MTAAARCNRRPPCDRHDRNPSGQLISARAAAGCCHSGGCNWNRVFIVLSRPQAAGASEGSGAVERARTCQDRSSSARRVFPW